MQNTLITLSDSKIGTDTNADNLADFYTASVLSATDYYAFGMSMKERTWQSEKYRYGFNGQERDRDIREDGNHNTAEFWEYSAAIGRRWNIDPVERVGESLYAVNLNNPIGFSDRNGDAPNEDKPVPVKPPSDDKPVPTKPNKPVPTPPTRLPSEWLELGARAVNQFISYFTSEFKADAKVSYGNQIGLKIPITQYFEVGFVFSHKVKELASAKIDKKKFDFLPKVEIVYDGILEKDGDILERTTSEYKVGSGPISFGYSSQEDKKYNKWQTH